MLSVAELFSETLEEQEHSNTTYRTPIERRSLIHVNYYTKTVPLL